MSSLFPSFWIRNTQNKFTNWRKIFCMILLIAPLDSIEYLMKCPQDSGLVDSWNNFLACLNLQCSCPAWRCSAELEWKQHTLGTPCHILMSVVFKFEFSDCFLVVIELHSKHLRSTFLHICVMCNIGLIFLVGCHRIPKNLAERAHTFEQKKQFYKVFFSYISKYCTLVAWSRG